MLRTVRSLTVFAALAAVAFSSTNLHGAPQAARRNPASRRFMVVARSAADVEALRAEVIASGGKLATDLSAVGAFAVTGSDEVRERLRRSTFASGVGTDHIVRLINPTHATEMQNFGSVKFGPPRALGAFGKKVTPDPAFSLDGLMWNIQRIDAPSAWKTTLGSPAVKVGVADTGLDYTHSELASKVLEVVDFTATEDPPICSTYFDPALSDSDWAAMFGGPATTDWNGHGSWIGGNIAAALDGQGVNGIAPKVGLVALKISQWCGAAYDSEMIAAFLYAADHGIDVVNISFGGYLDRSDPDQDLIYSQYVEAIRYARRKGTVIVAAAGNEHVRIGAGGQVLSHGSLTLPGDPLDDLFGLYEVPGGIPGVVDVSSTGNLVNAASATCAAGTADGTTPTCKPATDAHQPKGVGRQDQLAYYSNYGPRIDVAAPGGARKFNLPNYDRGGTPGFPYTDADGFTAWQTFSITSNWALEIPCFLFTGGGFPEEQCYSTIQGTSMAAPHATATVALIASAVPLARHVPAVLELWLKLTATGATNKTQPLSATDLSPGDLTGIACATGFCHLGGPAIPDSEAYGAGVINAKNGVRPF